jgi:hypothetical protein
MNPLRTLSTILPAMAIAGFLYCAPVNASNSEQRVACPALLPPDAIQPTRPPTGWSLYMPRDVNLTEGGMLQGPPAQSAYMVPRESKSSKSGKRSTLTLHWTFPAPEGDEVWIYCGYGGAGAPLQLFKRVADDATECTLSSRTANGRVQEAVEFVCK